jgi:hypothetical protein
MTLPPDFTADTPTAEVRATFFAMTGAALRISVTEIVDAVVCNPHPLAPLIGPQPNTSQVDTIDAWVKRNQWRYDQTLPE